MAWLSVLEPEPSGSELGCGAVLGKRRGWAWLQGSSDMGDGLRAAWALPWQEWTDLFH